MGGAIFFPRMVRNWTCALGLFFVLFAGASLQGMAQLERLDGFLRRSIDAAELSMKDADCIRTHVVVHGWPTSIYEANVMTCLDREVTRWLAVQPEWANLCSGLSKSSRNGTFRMDWRHRTGVSQSFHLRAGHPGAWMLRWMPNPMGSRGLAGHAIHRVHGGIFHGWRILAGDHSLQWGQGVVAQTSSMFKGLRSPVSVIRSAQLVIPQSSGTSVFKRSGWAAWWQSQDGRRFALSHNLSNLTPTIAMNFEHKHAHGHWGFTTELGRKPQPRAIWSGHGEWHERGWVVASEFAYFRSGWAGHLGLIRTCSSSFDVFARIRKGHETHPGRIWKTLTDPHGVAFMAGWQWAHPLPSRGRSWGALHCSPNGDCRFELEWTHIKTSGRWTARARLPMFAAPLEGHVSWRRDREALRFRCRADVRVESTKEANGWLFGCIFGAHPEGVSWGWDVSWMRSHLAPSSSPVYVLEPGARGWSASAYRGQMTKVNASMGWRVGDLSAHLSAWWAQRLDAASWTDSTTDLTSPHRFQFDMRLNYSL